MDDTHTHTLNTPTHTHTHPRKTYAHTHTHTLNTHMHYPDTALTVLPHSEQTASLFCSIPQACSCFFLPRRGKWRGIFLSHGALLQQARWASETPERKFPASLHQLPWGRYKSCSLRSPETLLCCTWRQHSHPDRLTSRQADKQTDRETDRETDRLIDRQTDSPPSPTLRRRRCLCCKLLWWLALCSWLCVSSQDTLLQVRGTNAELVCACVCVCVCVCMCVSVCLHVLPECVYVLLFSFLVIWFCSND